MKEIRELKDRLEGERPVEWEELPDIGLYMDQLISYMPRQVISVKDAGLLLEAASAGREPRELYAQFREALDRALDVTAGSLDASDREEDLPDLALALALRSYADKLACQRLLELIRARRPQDDRSKRAKAGRERPAE